MNLGCELLACQAFQRFPCRPSSGMWCWGNSQVSHQGCSPQSFFSLPLFQHIQGRGIKHHPSPESLGLEKCFWLQVLLHQWRTAGEVICICVKIGYLTSSHRAVSHVLSFLQNLWPSLHQQGLSFSCGGVWPKLIPGISCHGKVCWCFPGRSLSKRQTGKQQSCIFQLTEFKRSRLIYKWTLGLLNYFCWCVICLCCHWNSSHESL